LRLLKRLFQPLPLLPLLQLMLVLMLRLYPATMLLLATAPPAANPDPPAPSHHPPKNSPAQI
jgi:hypothetical protein